MGAKPKPAELPVPTTPEEVRELLRRVRNGEEATLPALRKVLERPATVEALGGNLARCAETSFVKAICGDDLAVREAVYAKLAELRNELSGDNPTPMERLLVERAVACWLQVQDADVRYAQGQKDMTFRQGDFNQRRMDAAHKRYMSALKTLALVRRLAVPALQVNIAKKQVNVVAPAPVGPSG